MPPQEKRPGCTAWSTGGDLMQNVLVRLLLTARRLCQDSCCCRDPCGNIFFRNRTETDSEEFLGKTRDMKAEVQGSVERLCRGGLQSHARPWKRFLACCGDAPREGLRLRARAASPAASARVLEASEMWSRGLTSKGHDFSEASFQTRPESPNQTFAHP